MKRSWLLVGVAVGALVLLPAAKAQAWDFPVNGVGHVTEFGFEDRSDLYQVDDPTGEDGETCLELRAIFRANTALDRGLPVFPFLPQPVPVNAGGPTTPIDLEGGELAGLLYDLQFVSFYDASADAIVDAPTTLADLGAGITGNTMFQAGDIIFFAPLGRNPLEGGSNGGVLELYYDATPDVDLDLAKPSGWDPAGNPDGRDQFVSNGSDIGVAGEDLELSGDLESLVLNGFDFNGILTDTSIVYGVQISSSWGDFPGAGLGVADVPHAFIDVVGGTSAGTVLRDALTLDGSTTFDVRFDSDLDELLGGLSPDLDIWAARSDDPAQWLQNVPEPASLLVWLGLAGFGSTGFGLRLRRRLGKA